MWTSGTLLGGNFDLVSISATGTGVGNTISVTTDQEHGLQIGANVCKYRVLTHRDTTVTMMYRLLLVTTHSNAMHIRYWEMLLRSVIMQ
jgi:hypothetical protein